MADVLLEGRVLVKHYPITKGLLQRTIGWVKAVDGISFEIHAGESFALVGESGCGKSVTALSIMQLIQKPAGSVAGGNILYKGQDIVHLPEVEKRKLRGNEISMIFQEPMTSLNPVFTVGEQIMEVFRRHQGLERQEAWKQSIRMLEMVRIPEPEIRFGEYPHQLSGGHSWQILLLLLLLVPEMQDSHGSDANVPTDIEGVTEVGPR